MKEIAKVAPARADETWQPVPKTLKILSIGNSFSDDMMEYVWEIAHSLGVQEIKLGNLYIGGCPLDLHYSNAMNDAPAYEYRVNTGDGWKTTVGVRMGDAIQSEDWQYISFQQSSGSSGMENSYGCLSGLTEYVRERAPKEAKFVWHMTWAYQKGSDHGEFFKYDFNPKRMYEKILATVQSVIVPRDTFYAVVPSGTAIQNARTSKLGDTLTRDGFHLSMPYGRYVAGLTLVATLTGSDISGVRYAPDGVTEIDQKIAIESAKNAVKKPFGVTMSAFTEK